MKAKRDIVLICERLCCKQAVSINHCGDEVLNAFQV
jgi:hypothetical protein